MPGPEQKTPKPQAIQYMHPNLEVTGLLTDSMLEHGDYVIKRCGIAGFRVEVFPLHAIRCSFFATEGLEIEELN